MVELSCEEIGIADCDYVARGETAGDIVDDMVEHLEDQHDIALPDPDDIMSYASGDEDLDALDLDIGLSEEARIVTERIRNELNPAGPDDEVEVDVFPPPRTTS
jgi:predicted small metal-binding protein